MRDLVDHAYASARDLARKPVPTFRDHAYAFARDLARKPVPTFRDHALSLLLGVRLELGLERRQLGERRIGIGFTIAPLARARFGRREHAAFLAATRAAIPAAGAIRPTLALLPAPPRLAVLSLEAPSFTPL